MAFFQSGTAAVEYAFNRDDESRADVRLLLDEAWAAYEPYCPDPHFLEDAKNHFHARTWEMLLAFVLLGRGYQLKKPPADGPDVQIVRDGRSIWLEAIAVERGSGRDRADEIVQFDDGKTQFFTLSSDKTALRYTNAINKKILQMKRRLDRGVVGADDVYLIAINNAFLPDFSADDSDPEVVKAVYPIGDAYVAVSIGQQEPPEWGYKYRGEVTKASGAKVSTAAFQLPEYAPISGIVCARSRAWSWNQETYKHWLVVHNQLATNALPVGFFPFGREAVVQNGQLTWTNHSRGAAIL